MNEFLECEEPEKMHINYMTRIVCGFLKPFHNQEDVRRMIRYIWVRDNAFVATNGKMAVWVKIKDPEFKASDGFYRFDDVHTSDLFINDPVDIGGEFEYEDDEVKTCDIDEAFQKIPEIIDKHLAMPIGTEPCWFASNYLQSMIMLSDLFEHGGAIQLHFAAKRVSFVIDSKLITIKATLMALLDKPKR